MENENFYSSGEVSELEGLNLESFWEDELFNIEKHITLLNKKQKIATQYSRDIAEDLSASEIEDYEI